MEEQMQIIIAATDNASSTFRSVENAVDDLGDSLGLVGDEGTQDMDELGNGADQAEDDVRKLGDEANKTGNEVEDLGNKSQSSGATMQVAFQNIADGLMRAKEGVVELGRNLMETLDLAGQQQQQETFLKMNIGAEGAAKQMKIINGLVADLPGDDVAIGGLLSQAAAKNAGITADELKRMGTNAADYFAAMSNYGKSSAEAQQDLTNYILTGNTAELERSPILASHIDKLKEANTVEERNKALQEAMNEEGWAGISQQDTYNNKLETFTAMLDRGKRQMGEMFLDAAGGAMDFIGKLDEATGGVLGIAIAAGSVTAGPLIDLFTGVGQMATGVKALRDAYKDLAVMETIANALEGEGVIARVASALGITTEAAAADGAAVSFMGLAIAEDAALWPILAIAAAIAALIVVVYEVGKAFGWWDDVGGMLDAISAGLNRLWQAFINHPDVQAIIQALSQAWDGLSSAIGGVISWIGSFFEVSNGGNFDVVRAMIEGIGLAWEALTTPIRSLISVVQFLIGAFQNVGSAQIDIVAAFTNAWTFIQTFIGNILLQISMAIVNWGIQIFTAAVSAGQRFVNGVITYIKTLPLRLLMYLIMTATYIRTQFTKMVTTARQKALQLVSAVANLILGLPRRMLSGLLGGVTSIVTAGGRWVSNARTQAGKVVTAVSDKLSGIGSSISSALSGVVNAFTKPFKEAYNAVARWVGKIKDKASEVPVIGGAFGGEDLPLGGAYGGEDLTPSQVSSIEKMEIHTTNDVNLNLDLRNVPSGIDETVLRNALVESLTSKDVLSVLVNNNDFQSLDNRAKARILARSNRARGV